MALAVACDKNADAPTAPSSNNNPSGQSFVGAVTVPGGSGLLTINTTTRVGTAGASPLDLFFNVVEPRVFAQSGADAALLLIDGTAVSLTGTVTGNTFQLSGEQGYGATATASGGQISGTVTTPQGTGTVRPMGYAAPYVPPPTDPRGIYLATYSMNARGYLRTVAPPSQTPWRDCRVNTDLTGTLRLEVEGPDPELPGFYHMDLRDSWVETNTIVAPCQDALSFAPQVVRPTGSGIGKSLPQELANIQVAMRDAGGFDGTGRRDYVFVGRFNGTAVDAVFSKARKWSNVEGANQHTEGYPLTEVTLTLRKQ